MNDFFIVNQNGLSKADFLEADPNIDLSKLSENFTIRSVSSLEKAKSGDLSFFVVSLVSGDKYKHALSNTQASYVLLKKNHQSHLNGVSKAILSDEPYITFIRLCKKLFLEKEASSENVIDASAVIADQVSLGDRGVKIGKNVCIESFVKIGSGVEIGDNTIVKSGAKIGNNCKIGQNCIIRENCVIQYTTVGDNSCIHSNSSIGQDGFGYAFDARTGKNEKIYHFGSVKIGNNVEIGACTCVDRSVFEETIIEDNVKLDNLVQVAHNVKIGCGTMMAGQSAVAGGATIGKYCVFGGKSAAIGHIQVGDGCIVYGDAKITKSFPAKSKIIGTPGELYGNWIKKYARLQSIIDNRRSKTGENVRLNVFKHIAPKFFSFLTKKH